MSEILEPYAVKDVPWSTMNPRDKGPRWVVVAVDNVEAGWSDISSEPNLEAYISLYVFDAWRVYYACSPEKLFQLASCGNVAWCKEETPEDERERIFSEWETGGYDDCPLVSVHDMECGNWGTVVRMYPDDGECSEDDGAEYNKYVDGIIEHVLCNPPLLDTTAEAARVRDPTCLPRHLGAKEKQHERRRRPSARSNRRAEGRL